MDNIDKLYNIYNTLASAKENILDHEKEYLEILEAVKGSTQEKNLASQFISCFFKDFPQLAEKALDAHLDLCEDDDNVIRKQAIKNLPNFCKHNKNCLPKIADALTQLLQIDMTSEQIIVHNALMELLKMDTKATLGGIFLQILGGEDLIRERAIIFLCNKIKSLGPDLVTKEVEEYLLAECKKVLQDVTSDEFVLLLTMLSSLKMAKLVPGQQAIVDMVADQADLDKPFSYTEIDGPDKLLQSIKQILPHFSMFVSSAKFVEYICINVLPNLSQIPKHEKIDLSLELLKVLAEMAPHAINIEKLPETVEAVYDALLNHLPLPPKDIAEQSAEEETSILFTHVECLLFVFHQLAKHHTTFLAPESNPDRIKDLKLRLQFLALKNQGYIKKLKESIKDKKESEMKTEENKLKLVALRTTTNINALIRDLFHNPPTYKVNFTLSWKEPAPNKPAVAVGETQKFGGKRSSQNPIVFDQDSKRIAKGDRQIYTPPGGKYSTKFQANDAPFRGGFRGRGGNFRGGRGGFRGWRR